MTMTMMKQVKREFIQCTVLNKTSNALFTLAETKQYCVKKLFKTVNTTCRISKLNQ